MNEVLNYLLKSAVPVLQESELGGILKHEKHEWQNLVDQVRGMLVTKPGMVSQAHLQTIALKSPRSGS